MSEPCSAAPFFSMAALWRPRIAPSHSEMRLWPSAILMVYRQSLVRGEVGDVPL